MYDAYGTTYGRLINLSKLKPALERYVNTVDLDDLQYEYNKLGNSRAIFITGYNDEEKELVAFDHPVIVKTLKQELLVVVDLRKYVNANNELTPRLSEVARDKNSIDFCVARAFLELSFINGNAGLHRTIYKPLTTAMGVWVSGMVTTLVGLDPVESFSVEVASTLYANTLIYEQDEINSQWDTIVARAMGSKHVFKLDRKLVHEVASGYVDRDEPGLETLIKNIVKVLPESKARFITVDSLISVMGNVFYGPGGGETPVIALEDMATWSALVYSVITNRSYQKSRIGMLLNKNKRVIDSAIIEKHISNFLKEQVIE